MLASDLVLTPEKIHQASNAGGEEDFEDEDEMDYDEDGAEGDLQLEEYGGELENAGDGDDTDQQDEAALLASLDIPAGEYRSQLE
jgi:hypothetical protein